MRQHTLKWLIALLTGLTVSISTVRATTIETFGDSITAGFLSQTQVTRAPTLEDIGKILSDFAMFAITKDQKYLVPYHSPELAWPAKLAGHLEQNSPIQVANMAVTGAHTADLLAQVQKINQKESQTLSFFFIGHNDLCEKDLPPPEQLAETYRQQYHQALAEWDKRHLGATAYLIPIADIYRVYLALEGYVWHQTESAQYTCETSWEKLFPVCRTYAKKLKEKTLTSYLKPRIDAMNHTLTELAAQFSIQSYRNRFAVLTDIHDHPYLPEHFALDCFHPSAKAQAQIAYEIWQSL